MTEWVNKNTIINVHGSETETYATRIIKRWVSQRNKEQSRYILIISKRRIRMLNSGDWSVEILGNSTGRWIRLTAKPEDEARRWLVEL